VLSVVPVGRVPLSESVHVLLGTDQTHPENTGGRRGDLRTDAQAHRFTGTRTEVLDLLVDLGGQFLGEGLGALELGMGDVDGQSFGVMGVIVEGSDRTGAYGHTLEILLAGLLVRAIHQDSDLLHTLLCRRRFLCTTGCQWCGHRQHHAKEPEHTCSHTGPWAGAHPSLVGSEG